MTSHLDPWLQHRKHSKTVTVDTLCNCTGLPVLSYLFKGTETSVEINSDSFDTSHIRKAQEQAEI